MKSTKNAITSGRLTLSWLGIIFGGAALYASFALAPFAIRGMQSYFSAGTKLLGWNTHGAVQSAPITSIGWIMPRAAEVISAWGVIAMALIGALAFWAARRTNNYRQIKRVSAIHLSVAALVVAITCTSYALMRSHSQAIGVPAANNQAYAIALKSNQPQKCEAITAHGSASSVALVPCSQARAIPHPTFGYGITPASLLLESAIFLVVPLLNWHRYAFSSRHIAGQKKDDLFQ